VDNRNRIPETWHTAAHARFPFAYKIEPQAHPAITSWINRISARGLERYIPGIIFPPPASQLTLTGIWFCPSNMAVDPNAGPRSTAPGNFFAGHYAYFAGISKWPAGTASMPDTVTDFQLPSSSNRILMADVVWRQNSTRFWLYNHGRRGSSSSWAGDLTRMDGNDRPDISGANQLMGDGSVVWMRRQDFQLDKIEANPADPSVSWVGTTGLPMDKTYYVVP
jgi:hypothetical protein